MHGEGAISAVVADRQQVFSKPKPAPPLILTLVLLGIVLGSLLVTSRVDRPGRWRGDLSGCRHRLMGRERGSG